MKYAIEKQNVVSIIKSAVRYTDSKSPNHSLGKLWLQVSEDGLYLSSSNGSISYVALCDSMVQEAGCVGVDGKMLHGLLSKCKDGEISFSSEGDSLVAEPSGSRAKYTLTVANSDMFQPPLPFPEEAEKVSVDCDALRSSLDRILFSVGDDDHGEAISCLYVHPVPHHPGDAVFVGLNGHQFSSYRVSGGLADLVGEYGLLVMKKFMAEIRGWLPSSGDVELAMTDKRLFVRNPSTNEVLSVPQQFYQYPNYISFVERVSGGAVYDTVRVNRKDLIDSLDRLKIFNSENNRAVFLRFVDDEIHLSSSAEHNGSASESISCEFDQGYPTTMAFPTLNLIEVLTHLESDVVELRISGRELPCGIVGTDEVDNNYLSIIMPMMVTEETYDVAA